MKLFILMLAEEWHPVRLKVKPLLHPPEASWVGFLDQSMLWCETLTSLCLLCVMVPLSGQDGTAAWDSLSCCYCSDSRQRHMAARLSLIRSQPDCNHLSSLSHSPLTPTFWWSPSITSPCLFFTHHISKVYVFLILFTWQFSGSPLRISALWKEGCLLFGFWFTVSPPSSVAHLAWVLKPPQASWGCPCSTAFTCTVSHFHKVSP